MKTRTYLPEDKIIHRALKALMRTLGPVETARFLTLPRRRRVESVRRHRQWQTHLDQARFFDEVFGRAEKKPNIKLDSSAMKLKEILGYV